MNGSASRLCEHWLQGLSSKAKARVNGFVMHDTRLESRAAFGRFGLRSTASGMSLVGTFAWNGRAPQGECEDIEGLALRIGIRPLLGALVLMAIMDIHANEMVGLDVTSACV